MKGLLRKIFNYFGYDVVKTDKWHQLRKNKTEKIRVGKYEIMMPGDNTLLNTYHIYPDFNSIIGRLAQMIADKYADMTVVDIGANVGDTIAIIKSKINVPIIGIEGDDISFKYLTSNTLQFTGVSIVNTFLSDRKSDINVIFENKGTNTTIIPTSGEGSIISFQTLNEVIDRDDFKNKVIKFIKLDIEGYDTIALRGAYDVIAKHQPALFFEYNCDVMEKIKEDGLSTLLSMREYGYNKIGVFDYMGRLLLHTNLQNKEEITCLHRYAIGSHNLLGYFDICIFHQQDDSLADAFFKQESANMK